MSADWTFLTGHGAVLLALHRDPEARLIDIADATEISSRWVIKLVNDLVEARYLERRADGRRMRYVVNADRPMRQHVARDVDLNRLIRLMADTPGENGTDDNNADDTRTRLRYELDQLGEAVALERERLAALEKRRLQLESVIKDASSMLRKASRTPRTTDPIPIARAV